MISELIWNKFYLELTAIGFHGWYAAEIVKANSRSTFFPVKKGGLHFFDFTKSHVLLFFSGRIGFHNWRNSISPIWDHTRRQFLLAWPCQRGMSAPFAHQFTFAQMAAAPLQLVSENDKSRAELGSSKRIKQKSASLYQSAPGKPEAKKGHIFLHISLCIYEVFPN